MFFHLTWLKDTTEKNYTLDFLIESEDIIKARAFLSEEKVITLGLDEYKEEPQKYWDFFAEIKSKSGATATIIWPKKEGEKIDNFIALLIKLKFDIVKADSYSNPIPEEDTKKIIEKLVKQEEEHEALLKKQKEEAEKKNKLNYTDDKLLKSYEAIDQVVDQIDQLIKIWWNNILPETKKKFDDMRWEIAKLRLATNLDKIIDELHKALNLIIDTQDFLLWKLEQEKIYKIIPGSQTTNVEVIREQARLFKAKLLSTLWAPLSAEEKTYISLGYTKLFAEYLKKDLEVAVQDKFAIVKGIFWWAELMILFILLEMVIMSVFWKYIGVELSLQRYAIMFIYLAMAGWLFRIINSYIRPKTIFVYVMCLLWLLLIYAGLIYATKIILVF